MKVRDFMVSPVITVREDCTLREAAKIMPENDIGALPVVNEQNETSGLLAESDFAAKEKGIPFSFYEYPQLLGEWLTKEGAERIYARAQSAQVREIMNRDPVTVTEEDTLETVLQKKVHGQVHRVPVVRGATPVGMVTDHDLLRIMLNRLPLDPPS
jgi:CBS domain-containing protein